jgi:hypothetical protein
MLDIPSNNPVGLQLPVQLECYGFRRVFHCPDPTRSFRMSASDTTP